jgi:subfamily B ATP-binding cassette protein HlyB/CyaB
MLLHLRGVAADAGQIRHRLGTDKIGAPEMLRCAKELGLKARAYRTEWSRLVKTPLPAIAALRDGRFMVVAKAAEDKVLVQPPLASRPALMTQAEFLALWDGELILMARRAGLADLTRRFDITWFLGAIHKYRHLLSEVLIISFFLQLFALVSPLFFQVVIDKVLVHRALTTLDVLMIGLLAISLFETVLSILRTYLFAHTTNRIDVEFGARLFHHLLALPMGYFQARRVGDSVARVRELENIRNFLTSSALTLVIDLFFTFVFLAVLFYYSPLLTAIVLGAFPLYIAISSDAALPAAAGREVPARRREPSLLGRVGDRDRDAQVNGGRAANAAPLGRTARRLRRREFPGAEPWQYRQPGRAARQQDRHGRHSLFRCQVGHRGQLVGR